MNQARRDARWRKRRIIYNNDGDDVIQARTPQETAQGLAERESGELIDDFVDEVGQRRGRPLLVAARPPTDFNEMMAEAGAAGVGCGSDGSFSRMRKRFETGGLRVLQGERLPVAGEDLER